MEEIVTQHENDYVLLQKEMHYYNTINDFVSLIEEYGFEKVMFDFRRMMGEKGW
jgi:hypothetical protein